MSIFDALKEQKEENRAIEFAQNLSVVDRKEILSNYSWEFGEESVDDETLEYLKEQTLKIHNLQRGFYLDFGSFFKEARDKLANHYEGVYGKWLANMGYNRTTVHRYISAFEYVQGLELDEQQRVIQLPARFVYEMATDKYTDEVKEKVIYGEINDFDEFKSYSVKTPFVKKTKHKEIKKEAVIDELLEIKLKLEELMDKFSKGDCSFEELSSLKKINKLIDKI